MPFLANLRHRDVVSYPARCDHSRATNLVRIINKPHIHQNSTERNGFDGKGPFTDPFRNKVRQHKGGFDVRTVFFLVVVVVP